MYSSSYRETKTVSKTEKQRKKKTGKVTEKQWTHYSKK